MEKTELLAKLDELDLKTDEEWFGGLEKRKLEELRFHDQNRDKNLVASLAQDTYEQLYGNKKFYRTVGLSSKYIQTWIENNAAGKYFLDYACGNGENAIKAAQSGAELAIGLDISRISVGNARQTAKTMGLENVRFIQGDCENTGLPPGSIDRVICSGMLHHLDLSYAFYELRRILKPGGVVLAIEALDYNPLIKLYRNLTPQMRTEWEKSHILSYKDIEFAARFFKVQNIRHWHLFSIAGVYSPGLLGLFNVMDRLILRLPGIKKMSWMFSFEMRK